MSTGIITPAEFADAQELDIGLQDLQGQGKDPLNNQYSYKNNILFHHKEDGSNPKPVLPQQLLKQLCMSYHYNTSVGHLTINQIMSTIQNNYHVHDPLPTIQWFTDSCFYCSVFKARRERAPPYLQNLQALEPRQIWTIDYAFGFKKKATKQTGARKSKGDDQPDSENQSEETQETQVIVTADPTSEDDRGILLMLDNASLFLKLVRVASKSANELVRCLDEHLLTMGIPFGIHSDMESAICSGQLQDYFAKHDIQHLPTAAHTHYSLGKLELLVNKIKEQLASAYHQQGKLPFAELLLTVANAHNKGPLQWTTSGKGTYTPESLFFGNNLKSVVDPLHIRDNKGVTIEDYAHYMQTTVVERRKRAADLLDTGQKRRLKWANKNKQEKTFLKDQLVWLKNCDIKGERSLRMKFTGPYLILDTLRNTATIQDCYSKAVKKAHYRHLEHIKRQPTALFHPKSLMDLATRLRGVEPHLHPGQPASEEQQQRGEQ
jgi:hypothetical protein